MVNLPTQAPPTTQGTTFSRNGDQDSLFRTRLKSCLEIPSIRINTPVKKPAKMPMTHPLHKFHKLNCHRAASRQSDVGPYSCQVSSMILYDTAEAIIAVQPSNRIVSINGLHIPVCIQMNKNMTRIIAIVYWYILVYKNIY